MATNGQYTVYALCVCDTNSRVGSTNFPMKCLNEMRISLCILHVHSPMNERVQAYPYLRDAPRLSNIDKTINDVREIQTMD